MLALTAAEQQVGAMATQMTAFTGRLEVLEGQYQVMDQRVTELDKELSAGIAGAVALAMMPAPSAGGHYITGGTGVYNGEQAVAIGMTGASPSGKFSYKFGGSATSSGAGTFGAGVGYRWR